MKRIKPEIVKKLFLCAREVTNTSHGSQLPNGITSQEVSKKSGFTVALINKARRFLNQATQEEIELAKSGQLTISTFDIKKVTNRIQKLQINRDEKSNKAVRLAMKKVVLLETNKATPYDDPSIVVSKLWNAIDTLSGSPVNGKTFAVLVQSALGSIHSEQGTQVQSVIEWLMVLHKSLQPLITSCIERKSDEN